MRIRTDIHTLNNLKGNKTYRLHGSYDILLIYNDKTDTFTLNASGSNTYMTSALAHTDVLYIQYTCDEEFYVNMNGDKFTDYVEVTAELVLHKDATQGLKYTEALSRAILSRVPFRRKEWVKDMSCIVTRADEISYGNEKYHTVYSPAHILFTYSNNVGSYILTLDDILATDWECIY